MSSIPFSTPLGGIPSLWAFDEETSIPPSIIWVKIQSEITPSYNEAYGGDTKPISLKDFLIRDNGLRRRIDGTVTREETKVELDVTYSLSEKWHLSANIPYINRQQTSSLSITTNETLSTELTSRLQETIESLGTKSFQGLGDTRVRAIYTFTRHVTSLNRFSFGLKLPTGNTELPRGSNPIEIGDQQYDILTALHLTYYPFVSGLRHNFRFEFTSPWKGTRRALESDEEVDYYGGNQTDFLYSISYEHNNWFWGGEYLHQRGSASRIDGDAQHDDFHANKLHFNVGIGNLTDLEKAPVSLPYEIRLGYETPLESRNIEISYQWRLMGILYF